MAQLIKKFIGDDQVGAAKILLENDTALRARNQADSADVDILRVTTANAIEFASTPIIFGGGTFLTDADKGVANGVASLDGTGRIPSSQLALEAVEFKGAYNATTNTPALIDGTGTTGDFYRVSVAGSQDFGSGSQSFVIGDTVIYNGTIWQKIPGQDLVTSVNGQQGDVVITGADAEKDLFTLVAGDITNGYVDLSFEALVDSIHFDVDGAPAQIETIDYTVNYTGGVGSVTRITFAGDLTTLLAVGDVVVASYLRA